MEAAISTFIWSLSIVEAARVTRANCRQDAVEPLHVVLLARQCAERQGQENDQKGKDMAHGAD